ncbi:hypothetical protein Tco_0305425 [Tanacetum coccineum]
MRTIVRWEVQCNEVKGGCREEVKNEFIFNDLIKQRSRYDKYLSNTSYDLIQDWKKFSKDAFKYDTEDGVLDDEDVKLIHRFLEPGHLTEKEEKKILKLLEDREYEKNNTKITLIMENNMESAIVTRGDEAPAVKESREAMRDRDFLKHLTLQMTRRYENGLQQQSLAKSRPNYHTHGEVSGASNEVKRIRYDKYLSNTSYDLIQDWKKFSKDAFKYDLEDGVLYDEDLKLIHRFLEPGHLTEKV